MSSSALSLDDALRDLQLPSLDVLKADLAKQSLPDFIRQAWPIVEPNTPLVWNWHLDEVCDVLQRASERRLFLPDGRPARKIIITIPPGLGKSLTISVFWNAWDWTRDASLRYFTASYSDVNTIRDRTLNAFQSLGAFLLPMRYLIEGQTQGSFQRLDIHLA